MAVTEIAILPLTHPITKSNPSLPSSLIQKFQTAKSVLESASGHQFYYFQQTEDPSFVYIIGKWDSVAAHATFLPSEENQRLLRLLKDDIVMSGDEERKMAMWHLDTDIFAFDASKGNKSVLAAPAISLNRHFVLPDKRAGFAQKFRGVKGLLDEYTSPYQVVGGWRAEKEIVDGKEREEWGLLSGFESVEHHMGFAKTEEFEKYSKIVGFVEGFEVRHLRAIKGL